jgi:hypothetical protein
MPIRSTFDEILTGLKHNVSKTQIDPLPSVQHVRPVFADVSLSVTRTVSTYGPNYYIYPVWNTANLQHWWTLDPLETVTGASGVRDSKGSLNGTETGTISTGTSDDTTIGRTRRYTIFAGSDYVDVGDVTVLDGLDDWTIACRFYVTTLDNINTLISRWPSANGDKQFKLQVMTDGKVRFTKANDASGASGYYQSDDALVSIDTWYTIFWSFDLSGAVIKLAFNGVDTDITASSWTTSVLETVADSVLIGREEITAGNDLKGRLADVAIWNTALSVANGLVYHNDAITDRLVANLFRVPGDPSREVLPSGSQLLDTGMGAVVSVPVPVNQPQLTNFM